MHTNKNDHIGSWLISIRDYTLREALMENRTHVVDEIHGIIKIERIFVLSALFFVAQKHLRKNTLSLSHKHNMLNNYNIVR